MRQFKKFWIILSLLFFTQIYAKEETQVNLCLTGKVESILPTYKLAFLNAVDLALSQYPQQNHLHSKTYFYDNKPLSAIRAYHQMITDHCSAIIGFEYLSDLILVSKQQLDTHIPIFTSYASSSDSDKLPKNIFIYEPSYEYQAKKMISFLHKKYSEINNVLLITEISRDDLKRYKIAYETLFNQKNMHYKKFDFIENDNQLENNLKTILKNNHYNYVFVLSGATGSTKIINMMNDHKTIFIGTENFGSSTNPSVYVRLKDKKITAFTIRNIDFLKRSKSLEKFAAMYTKKYFAPPSPLSAYTYDAVSIVTKSLEKYNSTNTNDVLKINYYGITGTSIHNKKFHRSEEYVILSISEKGFNYEE